MFKYTNNAYLLKINIYAIDNVSVLFFTISCIASTISTPQVLLFISFSRIPIVFLP
jgi:hypothetical protein